MNKINVVIGNVIIAITVIIMIAYYRTNSPSNTASVGQNSASVDPGLKVKIVRGSRTAVIPVYPSGIKGSRVIHGAYDNETPYNVYYNGGASAGGWEVHVPAFKDWDRLGYTNPPIRVGLRNVSFSLPDDAPMGEAEIYYNIFEKK